MQRTDAKFDGLLYWITGLSGAGKTTIGTSLYYEIKKDRDNVVFLDGDIVKPLLADDSGYTSEARHKRAWKYAHLCRMLTNQGMIVVCCTIAMFDEIRDWNRKHIKGYVEIFLVGIGCRTMLGGMPPREGLSVRPARG